MILGLRPGKPENAPAIGLSDSLWGFAQLCWDGDMKLRPKITEVVKHLETAAANWDGPMPPSVGVENPSSVSYGGKGSTEHWSMRLPPPPQNSPPNGRAGRVPQLSSEPVRSLTPPLNLANVAPDSQRRPDQTLISRLDRVCFSASGASPPC